MIRRIALLRAVNVGGSGKLAMSDLGAFLETLGFENVHTCIQSGNVVFEGGVLEGRELEEHLEQEAQARLVPDTSFSSARRRNGPRRLKPTRSPSRPEPRPASWC